MYIPGRAELDRRIAEAKETVDAYNACLQRTDWNPGQTEQMTRLSARGMYLLSELIFEAGQLARQLETAGDPDEPAPLSLRPPAPFPDEPAPLPQRTPGATVPADAS